jgi:putative flippase GtrA
MRLTPLTEFLSRFSKYTAAGAIGTVAHYLVLAIAVELMHAQVLPATTLGFIAGAIINYQLNRRVTFRHVGVAPFAFGRFFLIAVIGVTINYLVVMLLVRVATLHYLVCQLIATGVVLVLSFLANAFWTFRERRNPGETSG